MPITKHINIQEAVEGEGQKIAHINTYQKFKTELMINKIDDIFEDQRINIKKYGERYIFNIDNENKFSIAGANIELRIRNYCKEKETRQAEEDVLIRKTGLKIEYIKSTTQAELDALQYDINKLKESEKNKVDIDRTKKILARNIKFLEQEKEDAKKVKKRDKIDRNLRKAHEAQVQTRLDSLYRIKERIELIEKNENKKYTIAWKNIDGKKEFHDVYMDDLNGFDKEETLQQLNQRIEDVANDQPNIIAARNSIIGQEAGTVPYYEIIINSKSDARKLRNSLKKINNQYVILNKISLDAAKKQELAQDLQDLEEYLNKVITSPDTFKPSENPFIPKHKKEFFELVKVDPILSEFLNLNTKSNKVTENSTTSAIENNEIPGTNETTNTTTSTDRDFGDKNYIETFKEGGIKGMIRKTFNMFPNMTAQSKNTWTNLLVVGGVGFGLFKLGQWLFTGKRKKGQTKETPFRQRALIIGGVTLGFNAFGSNPFKFAEKFIGGGLDPKTLKIQLPWAKNETINNPETELKIIELNEVFGNLPVGKLKEFIDPTTFKLTEGGYNGLLGNFQGNDANDTRKRELITKMRTNKDKDILKTSFAKIGITPENINNLNQNKTVKDYTETYLPTIEGDFWDGIDDPRINITNQVNDFNITQEQKNNLIKYGNILYKERAADSSQKVEFIEKDTKIYLKTYDERTPIDTERLTIPGYNKTDMSPIVFSGYKELMKAANLTNYIKSIYRGKAKGNQYAPFESSGLRGLLTRDRGDIMFNDGTRSYNPTHTEAMDGGRFGTLGKISPKIEENKTEYITYLNSLNMWNESRITEGKPTR